MIYWCKRTNTDRKHAQAWRQHALWCAQFTYFTGAKVQILTPEAVGERVFNLDYGESSDEDYDGIRAEMKPMGLGWNVWNHTRFEQEVLNKSMAQKGVMSLEVLTLLALLVQKYKY